MTCSVARTVVHLDGSCGCCSACGKAGARRTDDPTKVTCWECASIAGIRVREAERRRKEMDRELADAHAMIAEAKRLLDELSKKTGTKFIGREEGE